MTSISSAPTFFLDENAGELRAYWTASGQVIEGDVNGDGVADFSIKITDSDHLIIR